MIPAIVAAGDRVAARAVRGESKVYLELSGEPLVGRVVTVFQSVPEVSEVWLVGDADRLEAVFATEPFRSRLRKPLHIVPQYRNLYENAWETYRRLLAGAPPEGRDPSDEEAREPVLYLSGDLPFATPQEISDFVRRGLAMKVDYVLGLVDESAMESFYPKAPGAPGIRMAYFNLREGHFRGSNLHLVKPALLANRHYIEEMYEYRYQKEITNMVGLGWRILTSRAGGLRVVLLYGILHLAGVADRRGWGWLADRLRALLPFPRVERAVGQLLGTDFRFAVSHVGGCAVDIDNEPDYDAALALFEQWTQQQRDRAEALHGPLALPAAAAEGPASWVREEEA